MYTLYFSPGSCSLIVNCLLEELVDNIEPFFRRMTERPAVARAMEREGIKPFGA